MFERLYHHPAHNPGLFWLVGLPLLLYFAVCLRRRPGFVAAFTVAFQAAILCDAAIQGELSPIAGDLKTTLAIVFVILGDLRFFVLLERFGREVPASPLVPLALSLAVPVASTLARPLLPPDPRYLFLVYELTFAAVALVVLFVVLPRRRLEAPSRVWIRRLAWFELVQYLGWAVADVVILAGLDAGYLLRLVPNAMYYAGFLPFAWFTAPRSLRP